MEQIIKGVGLFLCGIFIAGCAGEPPTNIGVKDGSLFNCPKSPNCVVSQHGDEKHKIAPISYNTTKDDAVQKIKKIILTQQNTKLIKETHDYLYFEFKSKMMGFVDDVEFYFPDEPFIHVRSASRVGYSDMGVNRKRIEHIRSLFNSETLP